VEEGNKRGNIEAKISSFKDKDFTGAISLSYPKKEKRSLSSKVKNWENERVENMKFDVA